MNELDLVDAIFKIIWLPFALIMGWQFKMITDLKDSKADRHELEKVEERVDNKADKDDVKEIKDDVKQILQAITEIKVEQAVWHGENRERKSNKS